MQAMPAGWGCVLPTGMELDVCTCVHQRASDMVPGAEGLSLGEMGFKNQLQEEKSLFHLSFHFMGHLVDFHRLALQEGGSSGGGNGFQLKENNLGLYLYNICFKHQYNS